MYDFTLKGNFHTPPLPKIHVGSSSLHSRVTFACLFLHRSFLYVLTISVFRIHKHADSLFSTSSGFSDFRGFFNLAVLLLVLSSARVALENIIK